MSVRAVATAAVTTVGVATLAATTVVAAGWSAPYAGPYAGPYAAHAADPGGEGDGCVAVVVDAGDLGGPVETSCAAGDPLSGLEALELAGFTVTRRARDGLLCAVGGRPACGDTDGDSYWSYWYRDLGSSDWTYSSLGAGSRDPQPGSVEAWVWQDGKGAADRAPGEDGSGANRRPPAVDYATICADSASAPATDSAAAPARGPATDPASTQRPTAGAAADGADSGAGPTGVLVGAVLVLGLGGAALLRTRRRGGAR